MKKALLVIGAACLFIAGFWFIAIPTSLISGQIEHALHYDDLYARAEGVRKGLLYSFDVEEIRLYRRGSDIPLAVLRDLRAYPDPLSFVSLNPTIRFSCLFSNGPLTGEVSLRGGRGLKINGSSVQVDGITALEQYGFRGNGSLSFSIRYGEGKGEGTLSVTDARLENLLWNGILLPLSLFHEIKGAAVVDGESIVVRSLALQGSGIHARVKGSVRRGIADMVLEVMTDAGFQGDPFHILVLKPYEVSPGFYAVPLKGDLSRLPLSGNRGS